MKREWLPYYISRGVLSAILTGVLILGGSEVWLSLLMGVLVFAGFLWYAHHGPYLVDLSQPLAPLRRDTRGEFIRDRAVVTAVVAGGLAYFVLWLLRLFFPLPQDLGALAMTIGVLVYFVASQWYFAKH